MKMTLKQLHDKITAAEIVYEYAVSQRFPFGTIVHVCHGDHQTRVMVSRTARGIVWVENESTGKSYSVDAYRLAEHDTI